MANRITSPSWMDARIKLYSVSPQLVNMAVPQKTFPPFEGPPASANRPLPLHLISQATMQALPLYQS